MTATDAGRNPVRGEHGGRPAWLPVLAAGYFVASLLAAIADSLARTCVRGNGITRY